MAASVNSGRAWFVAADPGKPLRTAGVAIFMIATAAKQRLLSVMFVIVAVVRSIPVRQPRQAAAAANAFGVPDQQPLLPLNARARSYPRKFLGARGLPRRPMEGTLNGWGCGALGTCYEGTCTNIGGVGYCISSFPMPAWVGLSSTYLGATCSVSAALPAVRESSAAPTAAAVHAVIVRVTSIVPAASVWPIAPQAVPARFAAPTGAAVHAVIVRVTSIVPAASARPAALPAVLARFADSMAVAVRAALAPPVKLATPAVSARPAALPAVPARFADPMAVAVRAALAPPVKLATPAASVAAALRQLVRLWDILAA